MERKGLVERLLAAVCDYSRAAYGARKRLKDGLPPEAAQIVAEETSDADDFLWETFEQIHQCMHSFLMACMLSDAELAEVVAFFESPVGARYVRVREDMVEAMAVIARGLQDKIVRDVVDVNNN